MSTHKRTNKNILMTLARFIAFVCTLFIINRDEISIVVLIPKLVTSKLRVILAKMIHSVAPWVTSSCQAAWIGLH